MLNKPIISLYGAHAILIQFDENFSRESLKNLISARFKIQETLIQSKVEVINTYNSLLINYTGSIRNIYDDFERLKQMDFNAFEQRNIKSRILEIPVCYDLKFGLDLSLLSTEKQLRMDELIDIHTAPFYTVYFIGFLPGFPYLGGLDKRLVYPRKNEPRSRIEKGAVGIAENQTGIYPKASPGGWQIIGNCPLNLFDKNTPDPCLLKPGDQLKFKSISLDEHAHIQASIAQNTFALKLLDR